MAKPELGTKRTCPETEKNFYDLNKDPVVSPYTGKEYPKSFFEGPAEVKSPKAEPKPEASKDAETEEKVEEEEVLVDGPEIISLEDAEDDSDDDIDDDDVEAIAEIPDVDVDIDDDDVAEDDDKFLEEDEDDPDLSDVIKPVGGDDEES